MSKMKNILAIGGGNHHNALGVIRALGGRGYGIELITHGSLSKNYIAKSKYESNHIPLGDVTEVPLYLLKRQHVTSIKRLLRLVQIM